VPRLNFWKLCAGGLSCFSAIDSKGHCAVSVPSSFRGRVGGFLPRCGQFDVELYRNEAGSAQACSEHLGCAANVTRCEEPARLRRVCLEPQARSATMMKTLVAAAFLASSAVAYGQTPTAPQHENPAPQSTPRSPAATLPETKTVAPDATGAPVQQQTTGQAPNVSKKMGAEMDSAGDQRASPDEQ
jgi:hypothetical protein